MTRDPQSLARLLSGDADGVFRFRPGGFAPVPGTPDLQVTTVATQKVRDKSAFLDACARALAFPPHFGQNWDAFYDCFAELGTRAGPALLLVFDDLDGFARTEPEEFEAALDALADAAESWRDSGRRLIALVGLGEPLLAPLLPEVSLR
jgi:RNAse (barnase) inhibitor barstar